MEKLDIFMVTHLVTRVTYIFERTRARSNQINVSAMPADGPGADYLINSRRLPHPVRDAARTFYGAAVTMRT